MASMEGIFSPVAIHHLDVTSRLLLFSKRQASFKDMVPALKEYWNLLLFMICDHLSSKSCRRDFGLRFLWPPRKLQPERKFLNF